ncbi:hypothetical protein CCM_04886 [Cordyceps militaris CM01]|uniref:Nuclear distribution protein n=1 Tax=Cordyceps militaris (strain CM01) TaxID=983644 RepID=G3JF72_CORMM|nr:uncharacterized protein CCM_04886 [Cordyceps militaris CM01]EGX93512.1 hypothetical protein CCM_04886 [Cordyceps militaris CM01]
MDNPLDQTTLSTISLLESRLLRVEHLLYGSSTPPAQHESVLRQMAELEKRFSILTSRIRVYGDLVKIYKARPDFFQTPAASQPPTQLPIDAVRAIVLSAAPSFPATVSALTAVQDTPVPDPAESAALVALTGRLRAAEAAQRAQEAEVAELRGRSEAALRTWYEGGLLPTSDGTSRVEARVGMVERRVRRKERERELEKEI